MEGEQQKPEAGAVGDSGEESDQDCGDSLFGEEESLLVTTPNTPGVAPINFGSLLGERSRRPHSSMGLAAAGLGLDCSISPRGAGSPLAGRKGGSDGSRITATCKTK